MEDGAFHVIVLPIIEVGSRKELVVSLRDHSGFAKSDFAIDYIAARPILVNEDSQFKPEYEKLKGSKAIENVSLVQ